MSTTITHPRHDRPATTAAPYAPDRPPRPDCGLAVRAVFLGSPATANRLAPPGRRGQAISAFFMSCYAGLIIPVVGAGMLSGFTGTFPAVLAFSLLLADLCLFSLAKVAAALRADTAAGQ